MVFCHLVEVLKGKDHIRTFHLHSFSTDCSDIYEHEQFKLALLWIPFRRHTHIATL